MKNFIRLMFFACTFIASHPIYAQESRQWHLQAIIPEDSIQYGHLYFSDSLHGFFLGAKFPEGLEKIYGGLTTYKEAPFYRTLDGGTTWQKIDYTDVYGSDLSNFDTTLDTNNLAQINDGWNYQVIFSPIPHSSACVISNMLGGVDPSIIPDTLKFYWSQDYGNTWYSRQTYPVTSRDHFKWEAAPADHEIVAMRNGGASTFDVGRIAVSHDNGSTFSDQRWDSTLLINLKNHVDSTNNLDQHIFDYFNDTTWIMVMRDTDLVTAATPFRLVTLLSTDTGHTWQAFRNIIPRFPHADSASVAFSIQCVRGTSYVYLYNQAYNGAFISGAYGVNYLYSSDFGKTWNIDTAFSRNRKAYFASAPGEAWCTATAHDSATLAKPAHWIVHTTDFGKTWDIDSSSLFNDGFYDGININFTDPRHGWIVAQTLDRHTTAIFKYYPAIDEVKPEVYTFKQYGYRYDNSIYYKVYPNPANVETTIQLNFGLQMTGVEFFDILGRHRDCPVKISQDQTSAVVQTGSLTSGCYLAHVSLQNANYIVPFMVQH